MPLLVLHFRNMNPGSAEDPKYASQKLKLSAPSVPINKLTLVGYAINTSHSGTTPEIPDHIVVEIDGLQSSNVNVASPPKTYNGDDYIQTHGIPLPLSSDANGNTIQFGMSPLEFDLNKKLERVIQINIKKFDSSHNLVPMTTFKTDNTVQLDHLLLYFQYDFHGLF